jgi:hypothetical protein
LRRASSTAFIIESNDCCCGAARTARISARILVRLESTDARNGCIRVSILSRIGRLVWKLAVMIESISTVARL